MRNRAKCKLCNEILESFHEFDYVKCKCDEISISGGNIRYECGAKNWDNFLRIDDAGNEIKIKVKKDDLEQPIFEGETKNPKPSKEDLIEMLDKMIENIENLPHQAMLTPINHYDFCSLLILLSSLFKSDTQEDCKEEI